MADDIGFLDRIKVGSVDERAILAQQQEEALMQNQAYAMGRRSSATAHGILNTVGGFFQKGGRSLKGVGENFQQGMKSREDQMAAQAAGIDVETLTRRRKMRDALSKAQIPNDGSTESRLKLARVAASEAINIGDMEVFAAANAEIQRLLTEEQEFIKLQHDNTAANLKHRVDSETNFWLPGNKQARSGTYGEMDINGRKVMGLHSTDDRGNYKFYPVGTYSTDDPNATTGVDPRTRPLQYQIKEHIGVEAVGKMHNLINTNQAALHKSDRLITGLLDMYNAGTGAIGQAGPVVSGLDNVVTNIQTLGKAFFGPGQGADNAPRYSVNDKGEATGIKAFMADAAKDPNNSIWDSISLPPQFRDASAAAQQHRALVMEMAYMAARLAEPSNRGLSDNDIKNALIRIAGDTTNPMVMIRRFAEMQADSAAELNFAAKNLYGIYEKADGSKYEDWEVDQALGGKAFGEYRDNWNAFNERHGITYIGPGQARFENLIDADTNPQNSSLDNTGVPRGTASDPAQESEDDFLNRLSGTAP